MEEDLKYPARGFATGPIEVAFAVAIAVEMTKETVKAIINWLKRRKETGKIEPRLKVTIEGDILKLSTRDMRVLTSILESSEGKDQRAQPK